MNILILYAVGFQIDFLLHKGRVIVQKWVDFRKSSKGEGGVHFQSKKIILQILDLETGIYEHGIWKKKNCNLIFCR